MARFALQSISHRIEMVYIPSMIIEESLDYRQAIDRPEPTFRHMVA